MTKPPTARQLGSITERERRRHRLPKHCECGGLMIYDIDFRRVFCVCGSCTPVVQVTL